MLRRPGILALAAIAGVRVAFAPPLQSHGPDIYIVEPEARYFANEGDVVTHSFLIRNIGDEPLEITDVKCTDCEVVGPDGQRMKFGPGNRHLSVSWKAP